MITTKKYAVHLDRPNQTELFRSLLAQVVQTRGWRAQWKLSEVRLVLDELGQRGVKNPSAVNQRSHLCAASLSPRSLPSLRRLYDGYFRQVVHERLDGFVEPPASDGGEKPELLAKYYSAGEQLQAICAELPDKSEVSAIRWASSGVFFLC